MSEWWRVRSAWFLQLPRPPLTSMGIKGEATAITPDGNPKTPFTFCKPSPFIYQRCSSNKCVQNLDNFFGLVKAITWIHLFCHSLNCGGWGHRTVRSLNIWLMRHIWHGSLTGVHTNRLKDGSSLVTCSTLLPPVASKRFTSTGQTSYPLTWDTLDVRFRSRKHSSELPLGHDQSYWSSQICLWSGGQKR